MGDPGHLYGFISIRIVDRFTKYTVTDGIGETVGLTSFKNLSNRIKGRRHFLTVFDFFFKNLLEHLDISTIQLGSNYNILRSY